MSLTALRHSWWMMAIRGALAIALGLAVLLWPGVTLGAVVLFFGVYAVLDGAWTLAAAYRAAGRFLEAWPLVLEGAVSLALGFLALAWPFVSRGFIAALVVWGLATGILELIAAARVPREGAGHWVLATAGVSSLFLAAMILLVAHGDADLVVRLLAAYALVFGVILTFAATRFRRGERLAEG